ncbi:hypothetical protein ACJX0J_035109, partial [Zea mays]
PLGILFQIFRKVNVCFIVKSHSRACLVSLAYGLNVLMIVCVADPADQSYGAVCPVKETSASELVNLSEGRCDNKMEARKRGLQGKAQSYVPKGERYDNEMAWGMAYPGY